jgi:hypothetical protein
MASMTPVMTERISECVSVSLINVSVRGGRNPAWLEDVMRGDAPCQRSRVLVPEEVEAGTR